jgi:hypothetical protein
VAFVVDKVALGQDLSEYIDFACQFAFHELLHNHHLPSGAGTIGQTVAAVPSRLVLTPLRMKENSAIFETLKEGETDRPKMLCYTYIATLV